MLTVEIVNRIEQELRYGNVLDIPITSMEDVSLDDSKFTLSWHKEPFPDRNVVARAIVTALYPDQPINEMNFDWFMKNNRMYATVTLG